MLPGTKASPTQDVLNQNEEFGWKAAAGSHGGLAGLPAHGHRAAWLLGTKCGELRVISSALPLLESRRVWANLMAEPSPCAPRQVVQSTAAFAGKGRGNTVCVQLCRGSKTNKKAYISNSQLVKMSCRPVYTRFLCDICSDRR